MVKVTYPAGAVIRDNKEAEKLVKKLRNDFRLEVMTLKGDVMLYVPIPWMDAAMIAAFMDEFGLELFRDPLPGTGHGWKFVHRKGGPS